MSISPAIEDVYPSLPFIKGKYAFNYPLSKATWFRVGGTVDILFKPSDQEDLINFLNSKPSDLPIYCIGNGSNLLVRDKGLPGCVIRLTSGFSKIQIEDDCIIAEAGCLNRTVVMACAEIGLSGLEFLVGIPGTIGGAVAMNAGAYGTEIKDILEWIEIINFQGILSKIEAKDLKMTYRKGNLPVNSIIIRAAFKGKFSSPKESHSHINKFLEQKSTTQVTYGRTGGSTFKNPSCTDKKAWELIDEAGCRGLKLGGAQVSEKHCNFLLNTGNATAKDIEDLGEEVRQRVAKKTNIMLEWEIIRLGLV